MDFFLNRKEIATRSTRLATFVGISTATILAAQVGHAAMVVTASEAGGNVVFSGGGTLNLADLNPILPAPSANNGFLNPSLGVYQGGGSAPQGITAAIIHGPVTGPTNFGPGPGSIFAIADSVSGDFGGINKVVGGVIVSANYTSGSSIFGTATYLGQTLQSLGLTPGVYEWTWGTANADSYKLTIISQPAAVPGPLPLVGAGAAFGLSRRLRKRISTRLIAPPLV